MTLNEYISKHTEDIRNESFIQNDTPSNVFLNDMLNRLESMEYIFNPTIMQFFKQGSKSRHMEFHAFAFDEVEKSLSLVINDYQDDDSISRLNQSDIDSYIKKMLAFLDEVYNGTIYKFIDPSNEVYKLSEDLQTRLNKDYVDVKNDDNIDKIKLFIITNKRIGNKVKNEKLDDFYGKQVELNVWDIERIFDIFNSGREKEPIFVDLTRYNNGDGIQYLRAEFDSDYGYDAYLMIIPGTVLSSVYWDHGSRLLEGNVRAFLSNRGKVNKGIRNTILKDPSKFFTYNNGIACTAKNVVFSEDKNKIIEIEDLQIINGGQTTASLTSALKKDKADLQNIHIPMKLTIIKTENYDEMIQNIARYANSQNKVTDADLFSNHPFHIEFERLSLRFPVLPKGNEYHNTYWFYERSRGKYQQSQFKLSKKAELDAYVKKYPRNQVIVKEDLAKYLMAGKFMRPDFVSRGRSKNMNTFAALISNIWVKDRTAINESFYKEAIAYAIIFKFVDKLVANAKWYNIGGIKLNIIPYTISKIFANVPKGMSIDLNRIWKEQTVYKSFEYEIDKVAQLANDFINDSKGVIPTEYAKKESTWNDFRSLPYTFSKEFMDDLVGLEMVNAEKNIIKKDVKQSQSINIEIEIFNLAQSENKGYWQRLLKEGHLRGLISYTESEIIEKYIIELSKAVPKRVPTAGQYKIAWAVRKKLEDNGVIV